MALREVNIPVQFAGGLDTKTDPKRVVTTQLLALENAVFRRDPSQVNGNGTNALCKRNGYQSLSNNIVGSTASPVGTRALGVRDTELLLFTDTECYSRLSAQAAWNDVGAVASTVLSDKVVAKTGNEQTDADSTVQNGVRVVAWVENGNILWSALDDATGRVIQPPTLLVSSMQFPRVVAVGQQVHIYYVDTINNYVMVAVITVSNLSAAPVIRILINTLANATPFYDVCPTNSPAGNRPAFIAWQSSFTGGPQWAYVDSTGALGTLGIGYPPPNLSPNSGNPGPIAVDWSDKLNGFAVAHGSSTQLYMEFIEPTLLASVATGATALFPGTPRRLTVRYRRNTSPLTFDVAIEFAAASPPAAPNANRDNMVSIYSWSLVGSTAVQIGARRNLRGLCLNSRMFRDDNDAAITGDSYVWTCADTFFFATYLLVRVSDGLVVARYLAGGAAFGPSTNVSVLASVAISNRVASWTCGFNESVESLNGDQFTETGLRVAYVDFNNANSHQSGQLGSSLFLSGGVTQTYDGQRWAEAGFHYAPSGITAINGTGGALTTSSLYQYFFSYEDVNAQGEIDRGPINEGLVVATGPSDTSVDLLIPTYRTTQRKNVRVVVWRSRANDASQFFRVTSLNPTATGANGFIPNDPTRDIMPGFIDQMSDAVLQTQQPLYTNGGIPSNDPVAGGSILVGGKGRIFTNDPVDPLLVHYSQQLADGFSVEFVPRLNIRVDPYGGPITGLAVIDSNLIVFKRDAMFVITGDGPLANPDDGSSQGFSAPQLITTDVGCIASESIGATPIGLTFQSAKGVYLLGRDLQVTYVGAPVEAHNSQTITRTTLLPDRTSIIMLTSDGTTLHYDYFYQQWSTFTNHQGTDAVIVNDVYYYLRNDGRVFAETRGQFKDDNNHIRMAVETAWVKLVGYLQGFQKILYAYVLGRFVSKHALRISTQFDYEDGFARTQDVPVNSNYVIGPYGAGNFGAGPFGGTTTTRYQRRVHLSKDCQAVRFRFEDIEATADFGASFELSELLINGTAKRGTALLGADRST